LTKPAAARLLSVSARQLSRFVADGSLVPVRLGPRLVRFTPAALADFVERRVHPTPTIAWPQVPPRRRQRG
jgi:excisionase family DNA binding protein